MPLFVGDILGPYDRPLPLARTLALRRTNPEAAGTAKLRAGASAARSKPPRFAERLDARFAKGRAEVDKLAQPILAKAFRGELVSTEAELARREGQSAETAEELLQRIRAKQQNAAGRRHAVPRGKKWESAHA